jgi:hypothetical protein
LAVLTTTSTVPAASAGATAVIRVDEDTLKLDAGTVPKLTWVAPLKPVPFMVTVVPPAVGPDVCESDETTGSVRIEVNWSAVTTALVPPGVVTVTSCAPAVSAGATAVIRVDEDTLKFDAGTVPNSTLVAPLKPVPFTLIDVPPVLGPDVGDRDVIVGAGPGGGGAAAHVNTSVVVTGGLVPNGVVTKTRDP